MPKSSEFSKREKTPYKNKKDKIRYNIKMQEQDSGSQQDAFAEVSDEQLHIYKSSIFASAPTKWISFPTKSIHHLSKTSPSIEIRHEGKRYEIDVINSSDLRSLINVLKISPEKPKHLNMIRIGAAIVVPGAVLLCAALVLTYQGNTTFLASALIPTAFLYSTYIVSLLLYSSIIENIRKAEIKENKEKKVEIARTESIRRQSQKDELDSMCGKLLAIGNQALVELELIPTHLLKADGRLDEAAANFTRRAFSPFWTSIEDATTELACLNQSISIIDNRASEYFRVLTDYLRFAESDCHTPTPPPFPVSAGFIDSFSAAASTMRRFDQIVGKAQTDYEFEMIYQQIKGNTILVAGFHSLGESLERLGFTISNSIGELRVSIDELSDRTTQSMEIFSQYSGADLSSLNVVIENANGAQTLRNTKVDKFIQQSSAREERVLTMLDNIQRKRKPTFWEH